MEKYLHAKCMQVYIGLILPVVCYIKIQFVIICGVVIL